MAVEVLSPEETLELCQRPEHGKKNPILQTQLYKNRKIHTQNQNVNHSSNVQAHQGRVMMRVQTALFVNSLAGPAPAALWSQRGCPTNLCRSCRSTMWSRYTAPPITGSLTLYRQRYASSCAEVGYSASERSDVLGAHMKHTCSIYTGKSDKTRMVVCAQTHTWLHAKREKQQNINFSHLFI